MMPLSRIVEKMAEEVIASAPVVEAPVVVAPVEAAPAVVAPVAEAPVVTVETPVVAPVEAPVEAKPLFLSEADKPPANDAEKPAEKPGEEAAKVEAEPKPLPIYEFKLPEEATKDNPVFKTFTEELGKFQTLHNVSQEDVQKFGQQMIDIQVQNVKDIAEAQNKSSWDWFNNRNKEWLESAKADPVIGGEAWDKTVSDAQTAISLYGGNKAQQVEVATMLQQTGVENHPAMIRLLANITRTAAKEGSPVSSQSVPVQKTGIANAMYGNSPRSAA